MSDKHISLIDRRSFRELFVEELGWSNPDHSGVSLDVEGCSYDFRQVAGYKGLRVWHCSSIPPRRIQRELDLRLGRESLERLLVFTEGTRQEWRWPRRARLNGANAKLLVHEHVVGEPNLSLGRRLAKIQIDFDEDLTLAQLLVRMRDAFDAESEKASVEAAKLMGGLYSELDRNGIDPGRSSMLLARLLFMMFADDTGMWEKDLFHRHVADLDERTHLGQAFSRLFSYLCLNDGERDPTDTTQEGKFPYVNGGLFEEPLELLEPLGPRFRELILDACDFDWGVISPAIFGSMFQVVKDKDDRNELGEFYTSEANVLKTIGPLFLDDLRRRLEEAWEDKAGLTRLHNSLAGLKYLDPACGCGNFLIVAYRELRALELEILKRRRDLDVADGKFSENRSQLSFDATARLNVRLNQFYGIDIESWPAKIAETAMLLVDHQANMRMEQEFGQSPSPLPITSAPNVKCGNALRVDWSNFVGRPDNLFVFGNPPFVGQKEKTAVQTADMRLVWGAGYNGYMDYVTAWFKKSTDFLEGVPSRLAFVSTSSVCQGQPVAATWEPLFQSGWKFFFAHRPFNWTSEARDRTGVHVVIVGLTNVRPRPDVRVFEYPPSGVGEGLEVRGVRRLNAYLLDADDIFVRSTRAPLSPSMPAIREGSKLWDFGHLVVKPADLPVVKADAIAREYLRPLLSNSTMLKRGERWVLWLKDASSVDLSRSDVLRERLEKVANGRRSSRDPEANRCASTPHLFTNYRQPDHRYLAIPKVTGHSRDYLPVEYSEASTIVNNTLFTAEDEDGFLFGIVSSRLFTSWQRLAGGHTRADTNFSNTLVWNTFPVPEASAAFRARVVLAGQHVLSVRRRHDRSLESLYGVDTMPDALLDAHQGLDAAVAACFGPEGEAARNEADRQEVLIGYYKRLVGA